jgi:ornithine decarboxylase
VYFITAREMPAMTRFDPTTDSVVVDLLQHRDRLLADDTEEMRLKRLVEYHGSPLLVMDASRLRRQFRDLAQALPGVTLYYAVKSLPNRDTIRILIEEGASLDLATTAEVELARDAGIEAHRTIHTHPIKKDTEIRAALEFGTRVFVIDNVEELYKFRNYREQAELLLRLRFQSPDAVVDLSRKFGCDPSQALELMRIAHDENIRIRGVSFHVGSQCRTADAHAAAIEASILLIEAVREEDLPPLTLLDIGGGFPADYGDTVMNIESFCAPIREALARVPADIRIIAEPGRFLVAGAVSAVASVVGRARRQDKTWYYLDDGVYGSFSGKLFDHANYPIEVFRGGKTYPSVLAGPTCDSIDVIEEAIELPHLELGDLVVGRCMGAYTAATATDFNGLPRARLVVINEEHEGALMERSQAGAI